MKLKATILLLAFMPLLNSCTFIENALTRDASRAQPEATPTAQAHETRLAPTLTAPPATPTPAHPQPVSPTPTASAVSTGPGTIAGAAAARFARYEPYPVQVTPMVPAYSTDLAQVTNPDLLQHLTQAQRDRLAELGFVVVPDGPEQLYALYKQAREAGTPVLVTADSLLHTFHILYDYTLRMVEIEHFVADLRALNEALLSSALAMLHSATSSEVQALLSSAEAAGRNAAFFAVASALLDPTVQVPPAVNEVVRQELALIDTHQGFAPSPLFGSQEDYSQYVPRGHYTRNETFERYFKCMMWYGRIGFHPTVRDVERARRETRQALMITAGLRETLVGTERAIDVWERIYEPTVFFVGQADDLTPTDYEALAQSLFNMPAGPAIWEDQDKLDAFRQGTRTLRPPRIVGGYAQDDQDVVEETRSFRFMGQRFVYDSYLFQQLVYDAVGRYQGNGQPFTLSSSQAGPIRGVPRGLDIAAVFGSDRALEILRQEGDADYAGYEEQMARLRQGTLALPAEQWVENLYWGWLYSLRPLIGARGGSPGAAGYPAFMQSQAWSDKELFTFLGSWTELRHDTILYAKQSYTLKATSIQVPPEPAKGYVEPQPEVYARLAALARQMDTGLTQRGLLNDEFRDKLAGLQSLLLDLKTIAEKELNDQPRTEDEYERIRTIGNVLEQLTTFSEEAEGGIRSKTDDKMSIVADVHTDSNTDQVLEEGVGNAFTLYAVVPHEGQTQVVLGPVFSHYEFRHPMGDRLTDEAWQEMPAPPLAPWTQSFIRD